MRTANSQAGQSERHLKSMIVEALERAGICGEVCAARLDELLNFIQIGSAGAILADGVLAIIAK